MNLVVKLKEQSKKNLENTEKTIVKENKYNSMTEKAFIANFLKNLGEKKYSEAHKYLYKIMEAKIARRILKQKNVKVF